MKSTPRSNHEPRCSPAGGLTLVLAWTLFLAAMAVAPGGVAASGMESTIVLSLRPDGSGSAMVNRTEARASVEQQVKMWEAFLRQSSGDDEESAAPAVSPPAPQEQPPLSDPELAAQFRRMWQSRSEMTGEESNESIEALNVRSNVVHIVTRRTFATIEETLPEWPGVLSQVGLLTANVKMELDDKGRLLTSIQPSTRAAMHGKRMLQAWKSGGHSLTLRLELPGTILSSGFPQSASNATWHHFDATRPEAVDETLKLYQSSIVITSESGGLKLARALESRQLQRASRTGGLAVESPVVPAGPGYMVQPLSITTTVVHQFPGAPTNAATQATFDRDSPGTLVRAKLYAPKGRTLQSVSGVRVLRALDDQGRTVPEFREAAEGVVESRQHGAQASSGTEIVLRLQLPEPDAQAIEELSGEAIVLSAGVWKELLLTNITASSTNEMDLSSLLPGARLKLSRFSNRRRQMEVTALLMGSAEVRSLELEFVMPAGRRANSHASDRNTSTRGGQTTRTVQLQAYSYDNTEVADERGAVTLRLRRPEDQRRERVQFVLSGLDLL